LREINANAAFARRHKLRAVDTPQLRIDGPPGFRLVVSVAGGDPFGYKRPGSPVTGTLRRGEQLTGYRPHDVLDARCEERSGGNGMSLVSASEYARRIGLSENTVRRLARNGDIPAVKVGKRIWRFDTDAPLPRPIPTSKRGSRPTEGRIR
jgi:excisionase family DNA binding protein